MRNRLIIAVAALGLFASACLAPPVRSLAGVNDAWFSSDEGRQTLANILTHQHALGGWNKTYDVSKPTDKPGNPTIDNSATWSEIRLLARAHRHTGDARYRDAAVRGIEFLLKFQYPSGGWPQQMPPPKGKYNAAITFNDDAMAQVMIVLRDIAYEHPDFAWVDDALRARVTEAFHRGIDCILQTQIVQDGVPTGWCAQHDRETLEPVQARAYELPSISGTEGAMILELLMSVRDPDERVRKAVHSAAAWFDKVKLVGVREDRVTGPQYEGGRDRFVVEDPSAPPMWARFYDLETNKPIFVDRDGIPKSSIRDIGHERRVGYAWYTTRPNRVLEQYQEWKKKHPN